MKVDLHLHTIASRCSRLQIPDLFVAAKEVGLDGICITDHEVYTGYYKARKIGVTLGFPVFMGIEVRTQEGDLLIYPLEEIDFTHTLGWPAPAQDVIDLALARGAFIVAPHPWRKSAPSIGKHLDDLQGIHALEVLSGRATGPENNLARWTACQFNLPQTAGSDAHRAEDVGKYWTEFLVPISTQAEFVRALHEGEFQRCPAPE